MPRLSAIVGAVATALDAASFKRSRFVYDLFGKDPHSRVHKSYAIGILGDQEHEQRRRGEDRYTSGTLAVQVAHQLRGDSQVTDQAAAWDAFEDADLAIDGAARTAGYHLIPSRRSYRTGGDGTFSIVTIEYSLRFIHYSP